MKKVVNLSKRIIDMRSDTVTLPTKQMRDAMSIAVCGDDVFGEDPTVLLLEKKGAELTQKEACCFVSSGTQGNLASFMAHCDRRASEIIVGDRQHTYLHEQGGVATLAGVHSRVIPNNDDGTLDIKHVLRSIRPCTGSDSDDGHYPRTVLVSVENTHNMCGGVPLSLEYLKNLKEAIKPRGVKLHMDGARVCNAAISLESSVSKVCEYADSVSLCLSKGLGAPVGTLVCGEHNFILRVRRAKKALGGGWRQAGLLAAAGLVALDTMQETIKIDHKNAQIFVEGLKGQDHIVFPKIPQTNLIFFQVKNSSPEKVVSYLYENGLLINFGYGAESNLFRAAIHRDITPQDIEIAVNILKQIPA